MLPFDDNISLHKLFYLCLTHHDKTRPFISQQTQNIIFFECSLGLWVDSSFPNGANRGRLRWRWLWRTHFSSLMKILVRNVLVACLALSDNSLNWELVRWRETRWPDLDIFYIMNVSYGLDRNWIVLLKSCALGFGFSSTTAFRSLLLTELSGPGSGRCKKSKLRQHIRTIKASFK